MAKKRRILKKNNHYSRFNRQRPRDIRKSVLTSKKKPQVIDIYSKNEIGKKYEPYRSFKQKKRRVVNIGSVPRETINKQTDYVNNTLQNLKNDARMELKVMVCGKRKERRQTLFRQGHAGRGVAGPIKKLKNASSKVRC